MKLLHSANNERFDKDNHVWSKLNKIYDIIKRFRNKIRNIYILGKNLNIEHRREFNADSAGKYL